MTADDPRMTADEGRVIDGQYVGPGDTYTTDDELRRLRNRQATIEARLRNDMNATLASSPINFECGDNLYLVDDLLDALVRDAMHQVDLLLGMSQQ